MNKEEKAIDRINQLCNFLDKWKENYVIVPEDKQYFETLLNLIQKQGAIIDKMAEKLTTPVNSKQWVVKYYEKEVENENTN